MRFQNLSFTQNFNNMYIKNNIIINFDSFLYKSKDNVFKILYEEQELAWHLYKEIILSNASLGKGTIPFLEVGCGSGYFSINIGKLLKRKVFTIDINPRAIEFTKHNSLLNNVEIDVCLSSYDKSLFAAESVNVILLNPPFHIYPPEIESKLPLFSVGGSDGHEEFKKQIKIANYHLSENGIIIFVMMCLGHEKYPGYIDYYKELTNSKCSVYYQNIFKPIKTKYFLKSVYLNNYCHFTDQISKEYPYLYFTNGYFKKDNKSETIELNQEIKLNYIDWHDRINLHKQINNF
jgi:SAM-dependent methyltransferase